MPMPSSERVSVPASLSKVTRIEGSPRESARSLRCRLSKRARSRASLALLTNSRRKISRSE